MKTLKLLFAIPLLISAGLQAQQAKWELVRENFWGKIAIDPTNSDIIYVSPGNNQQFGLHKSMDGGKTWIYYSTGYEILAEGIVIDPNNPQRLWIYGGSFKGVVRSEDGGMTAVRADTGIVPDHHGYSVTSFAYDSKRDLLYAGTYGAINGIYRSWDSGRHWQEIFGFAQGLRFDPVFFFLEPDSGWLYSGTAGQGIWQSKDLGATWALLHSEVLTGKPIYFIASVPNSRTLYAAALQGEIYRSYDLGETWTFIADATTDSDVLTGGFVVSSLDTNYMYTGGNAGSFPSGKSGFYLSRNGGMTWQLYHLGLPPLELYYGWSLAQTYNAQHLYFCFRAIVDGIYRLPQPLLTSVENQNSYPPFPAEYSLMQNFPNPFNGQTQIEFSIPRKEQINLVVLDIAGKQIIALHRGAFGAGNHSITWDGKNSEGGDVSSGVYLIRLQTEKAVLIRKLLLIR